MVPINLCQCWSPAMGILPEISPEWNKVWLAPYYHSMEAWGFPVKAAKLFHSPVCKEEPRAGTKHFVNWWDAGPGLVLWKKWTKAVLPCCGHAPGRQPLHMESVHIITGQALAHIKYLYSENCFHVSCSWHPGDLTFSTASQIPWLCSSMWRGVKTPRHVLNDFMHFAPEKIGGTDHLRTSLENLQANI